MGDRAEGMGALMSMVRQDTEVEKAAGMGEERQWGLATLRP